MLKRPKPLVLMVLGGFGYSVDKEYNVIAMAITPCLDQLQKNYSMTLIINLVYVCGDKPPASGGSLSNLEPTKLDFLAVKHPVEMTGRSLIASV